MANDEITAVEAIDDALADPEPTWVTLPPAELEISAAFELALAQFDAGPNPAARAATEWLQHHAITEYQLSRTTLYIVDGAIAGYYSLCSATVELSQRDRRRRLALDTQRGSLPASLVTWLAKDHRAEVDGTLLIKHAVAVARKAALTQASVALALDPFDEETAELWKTRYGFRKSAGPSKRLWIPLATAG